MTDQINKNKITDIMDSDRVKISFDIFHPLDHSVLEFKHCNSFYGGTKNHIELWWTYKSGINEWIGRQLHCRFGSHAYQEFWRGPDILINKDAKPTGYVCANCSESLY